MLVGFLFCFCFFCFLGFFCIHGRDKIRDCWEREGERERMCSCAHGKKLERQRESVCVCV